MSCSHYLTLSNTTKRAGLRALAATSAKRFSLAPELPTIAEAGVPGFDVTSWSAFWLPSKTPFEIIRKLNLDLVSALAHSVVKAKLEQIGFLVVSSTPSEVTNILKSDMDKWEVVIKEANIKLE